jgi:hypothetical protein
MLNKIKSCFQRLIVQNKLFNVILIIDFLIFLIMALFAILHPLEQFIVIYTEVIVTLSIISLLLVFSLKNNLKSLLIIALFHIFQFILLYNFLRERLIYFYLLGILRSIFYSGMGFLIYFFYILNKNSKEE